jgi:hypothetical protein
MKKIFLIVLVLITNSCSHTEPDEIGFSLGMNFIDYYKLIRQGIEKDSIGFAEVQPYYLNGNDTVYGITHERLTINLETSNEQYSSWRLEPIFYNDKLITVQLYNNQLNDIEVAKLDF